MPPAAIWQYTCPSGLSAYKLNLLSCCVRAMLCLCCVCAVVVLCRNLFSPNGPSVLLTNVTLLLPPPEAAQLAAMAAEAAAGAAPGTAQFQLSFPSGKRLPWLRLTSAGMACASSGLALPGPDGLACAATATRVDP